MITKDVTLWLCNGPKEYVSVNQFDTIWSFVFKIINDGLEWTIPAGASAVLNGLKPDGNVFSFEGAIANNRVTVNCDVQMTAVAGETKCELSLVADNKVVGTSNFTLAVEAAPKSPDDVSSESTLPAYEEALEEYASLVSDAVDDWLDEHPEAVIGGHAWTSTDIYNLRQVLDHVRYDTASASNIVDALISALEATVNKGWTTNEINLLDSLLDHVEYTDASGSTYADNLIASLRGAVV